MLVVMSIMINSQFYERENFIKTIKYNLRRITKENNLTVNELSIMIDLQFQSLADMESMTLIERYPSLETLRKICVATNTDINEFFKPIPEEEKISK